MDSGSLYSNMGPSMLGLEMSLHHQIPQQNPPHHQHMQQPHHPPPPPPPHHHHPSIVSYAHQENADSQQVVRQGFPFGNNNNKGKNQSLNFSDDDEPGPGVSADNNSTDDGKRNNNSNSNSNRNCPWQRMKWTDNMVKLLIMVVYYIGDEVDNNNDPSGKKKGGVGVGGGVGGVGVLQKKGKWKSVSRAMMERGFYVSPQQCEDKFNDLNKRYKRVNDILGKGTACRVVENQELLETMDHLSPKMKEEVKKLLNSKHLFFREMCAYHNSCGHNSASAGVGTSSQAHQNQLEQQQQQRCLHSSENPNSRIGASSLVVVGGGEGSKMPKGVSGENDNDDDNEDEDEEEEDDEEENDEYDEVSGAHHEHEDDNNDDNTDERSRKRQRKLSTLSPMVQQLSIELANIVQDRSRSPLEKRQWLKLRMMQLEEQHVSYQCQAFELQKQRLKWEKFISKKEKEMEREKLMNERRKLENERMVLLLKQKELELLDFVYQQHPNNNNNRNSDPSSVTG